MVKLIPLALIVALACLAVVQTSAQTPEELTPTPEPTKLTEPTPTPTATPIVAEPDEIVFTGELEVPVNTEVTALFVGVESATCATAMTETVTAEVSSFVLRVPASCAENRLGPNICWSDGGCYLSLALRPQCTVFNSLFGGCRWTDTVAPGKVVDFGPIPIAGPAEVIVLGTVPVPAGATVTLGVIDWDRLERIVCGSAISEETSDPSTSSFLIRADSSCSERRDLPHICWRGLPCYGIPYDHPFEMLLQPGRTIQVAPILDEYDPNATPTPLPGNPATGGGGPFLPDVGGRTDKPASRTVALPLVALALFGAAASAAVITSLRRA